MQSQKHSYVWVTVFSPLLHIFIFSLLIYHTPTAVSSPSSLPIASSSQLPSPSDSLLFLQKRAGLPGLSIKHDIPCYNNTRHIPLHRGWMRQPNKKKRVHKANIGVIDSPHSHCQESYKTFKLYNHYIHADVLHQTHQESLIVTSVYLSSYEPMLLLWVFLWFP